MLIKKTFYGLIACLLVISLQAQDEKKVSKEDIKANPYLGYKGRSAIAFNFSSVGLGFEYARNLNHRHLNARIRLNTLRLSNFERAMSIGGAPTQIVADINVFNTDLLLEYLPFSKSSFKLIGGVSFIFKGEGSVKVAYGESIKYGDLTITPEEIGDLTIGVDYGGVAPYMGLGFGRAIPKTNVGFGFELGTYYAGSPKVSLDATEMLSDTVKEEAQLQSNLSDYKWFPFINLRLSFKL